MTRMTTTGAEATNIAATANWHSSYIDAYESGVNASAPPRPLRALARRNTAILRGHVDGRPKKSSLRGRERNGTLVVNDPIINPDTVSGNPSRLPDPYWRRDPRRRVCTHEHGRVRRISCPPQGKSEQHHGHRRQVGQRYGPPGSCESVRRITSSWRAFGAAGAAAGKGRGAAPRDSNRFTFKAGPSGEEYAALFSLFPNGLCQTGKC